MVESIADRHVGNRHTLYKAYPIPIKLEGHSVERIPPWAQYIFEISCHMSFLTPSLNGEESL